MTQPLQLPRLANGIPSRLLPTATDAGPVLLARRLFEARIIPPGTPARAARDPLGTAKRCLSTWLAQQLDGLRCLNLHMKLLIGNASGYFGGPEQAPGTVTALWSTSVEPFVVGPALEALEALKAGLGQTVLTTIDVIGWNLIPSFTPADVEGLAQHYYWHGETNEETALDEMCEGDDPAEREAMREGMVTRKLIDEAYPSWATKWPSSRKALGERVLARVAKSVRSQKVRRVALLVLDLKRIGRRVGQECQPEGDGPFIGYGPVLEWRERDLTTRVFDDLGNDACQGEHVDWCGEHRFDLNDESSVTNWLELMEPRMAGIRVLDQLIFELSDGDWRRIPKGFRSTTPRPKPGA
jgi:PRTRC genetic system protein F